MNAPRRRIGLAAALVVASGLGVRVAADLRARARNASTSAAARRESAVERARIAAVRFPPATPGTSREAPCSFDGIRVSGASLSMRAAARKEAAEVPGEVAAMVQEARPELAKLSDALRCDRLEPGALLGMDDAEATMAAALVVDGHLLVVDGDVRAGATRYLEAARLGANAGARNASIGWHVSEAAFLALARLMAWRPDAPRERIASFLDELEPVLPSSRDFARHVRLALAEAAERAHAEPTAPLSAPKYADIEGTRRFLTRAYVLFYPQSVRYAQAMEVFTDIYGRAELLPDGASVERTRFDDALLDVSSKTTNPFVHDLVGSSYDPNNVSGYAAFALARGVARLEAAPAPAALPAELWAHDPATNASPFGYERTPDGYRVWSAGNNGKDDGGSGDDVVVQHRMTR